MATRSQHVVAPAGGLIQARRVRHGTAPGASCHGGVGASCRRLARRAGDRQAADARARPGHGDQRDRAIFGRGAFEHGSDPPGGAGGRAMRHAELDLRVRGDGPGIRRFGGEWRVQRHQASSRAAHGEWPRSTLDRGGGEPVLLDAPALGAEDGPCRGLDAEPGAARQDGDDGAGRPGGHGEAARRACVRRRRG